MSKYLILFALFISGIAQTAPAPAAERTGRARTGKRIFVMPKASEEGKILQKMRRPARSSRSESPREMETEMVLEVIEDGIPIIEKGVFDKDCYYGVNESISDHAPVIYGTLGTWNITNPINHINVSPPGKPGAGHINHTFLTDDKQIVKDRSGRSGDLGGDSEKVSLKKVYTPEKVKQLIETTKDGEVVRDIDPLLKKVEEARVKAIGMAKEFELAADVTAVWNNTINEMKADAVKEIEDPMEENFANTRELLRLLDESRSFINNKYVERMEAVATKIKEIFKRYPEVQYFVVQEVPRFGEKTLSGESVGQLLKEAFEPADPWLEAIKRVLDAATVDAAGLLHLDTDKLETIFAEAPERVPNGNNNKLLRDLTAIKKKELEALKEVESIQEQTKITQVTMDDLVALLQSGERLRLSLAITPREKAKTTISNTKYRKNNALDVALVSRASAPILEQINPPDVDNRLVPWCSTVTKICYVAAHLPMAISDEELKLRCQDIRSMAISLRRKNFKEITFAGDFNVDAKRVLRVCQESDLKLPKSVQGNFSIHSIPGQVGNSCGAGNRGIKDNNIDIMIQYRFN